MESETKFIPKPEKPAVLFHASSNPTIDVFEPRSKKTRDVNEGPRVFGTPSRALASVFLVDSDDSWVQSGTLDDDIYIIISDEERFRASDTGGVIYSLPNDTFENDPEKGLGELEWTSKDPVTPTGKEYVPSALADMIKQGVKVYFVDTETYQRIRGSSDDGESIMENLVPYKLPE